MAKATKTTEVEDATITSTPATDDLFAGYTDEEKAELLALTGQAANLKGDKVPVLKTNYCDLTDRNGNEIKKGMFVFDQNSKEYNDVDEDGDEIVKVEDIGKDLGKSPEITVLAYRQQYAFYSDNPKDRCSSQIFGNGETPVGNNLKMECRSKTNPCPRRAEGIDRKEKCTCQYVVMAKVNVDGESKPAMMYVKGKSFMPFGDYLKAAGNTPLFFAPTKLSNKMEKQGAVTYWTTSFELLTDKQYPQLEARENMAAAKESIKGLEAFKQSQFQKAAASQIVDKSAGPSKAISHTPSATDVEDDIVFD